MKTYIHRMLVGGVEIVVARKTSDETKTYARMQLTDEELKNMDGYGVAEWFCNAHETCTDAVERSAEMG